MAQASRLCLQPSPSLHIPPPHHPDYPPPVTHRERILIIRPSALGDVCRTAPVLAALRKTYPDARIDWMVRDTYVNLRAARAPRDLGGGR